MEIRPLELNELKEALELTWNVFQEFEAPDYEEEGIREFRNFIALDTITDQYNNKKIVIRGAFINDKLVGILATRDQNHISLLFVKTEFHRQGIAKALFLDLVLRCRRENINLITVNSSPYAIDVYHRFGFKDVNGEQLTNGIRYTPMEIYLANSH